MKTENLIKASQTIDLLCGDLEASHSDAIGADEFAAIVLLDLMTEASILQRKIGNAMVAAKAE